MLAHINLEHGQVKDPAQVTMRRLSDMASHYQDAAAVQSLLKEDPVIYRVYMPKQPGELIGLYAATSVIEPGIVGTEFYMTKGHFHKEQNAPEIYLTLSGQGVLLMQNHEREIQIHEIEAGDISYIPGEWAHRTINTGDAPLVFFAVWPVDAGHNYESIEKSGFIRRVLKGEDGLKMIVNVPAKE
jgi:glucose-6-phosphate isomerase